MMSLFKRILIRLQRERTTFDYFNNNRAISDGKWRCGLIQFGNLELLTLYRWDP